MQAGIERKPNALIHESSPYLLQHAYNPVNWLPFTAEAFEKARAENKLVLVSVGYSACHWCHVMEYESFEDEQVAAVMNEHFICIKVDREERADVDMLYMHAVQLMTGHGGWPMNCFVLPDGKPCYGGTYFTRQQWLQVLVSLANLYREQPEKVQLYAEQLTQGIVQAESFFEKPAETIVLSEQQLKICVDRWRRSFDDVSGGPNRAPKFPMPSNYLFLLRYANLSGDDKVLQHVNLTLTRMAFGGIYDQVHGGFARYSVDAWWKVPHFEKMLYDNAQLAFLYTEAFTATRNPLYASVAKGTLDFIQREWLSPEGGFYSAYDADSEGEEGKFYVWSKDELEQVLGDDFALFSRYYEINENGYWEKGNYILMRNPDFATAPSAEGDSLSRNAEIIDRCLEKLRATASQRIKPGLDDKIICSWNAMTCSAFAYAALVFEEHGFKEVALRALDFMLAKLRLEDGHLLRTYKHGKAKIHAFLDDYAFMSEALLWCYYLTQDEKYLNQGKVLLTDALDLFENKKSVFLYYTSRKAERLLTRNMEISDNVIPASNSQIAHMLFVYGRLFGEQMWISRSMEMLSAISTELISHGPSYSNWGSLALFQAWPLFEMAIVGKNVDEKLREVLRAGVTNTIFAVSASHSRLALLRDRFVEGKTLIYVCRDKTCDMPVEHVSEALERLG